MWNVTIHELILRPLPLMVLSYINWPIINGRSQACVCLPTKTGHFAAILPAVVLTATQSMLGSPAVKVALK